jgi:hypothetical protein
MAERLVPLARALRNTPSMADPIEDVDHVYEDEDDEGVDESWIAMQAAVGSEDDREHQDEEEGYPDKVQCHVDGDGDRWDIVVWHGSGTVGWV